MEYSTDLFDPATVERMLAHYRVLLGAVVAHPDQPIGALPMLTEDERRQCWWSGTRRGLTTSRRSSMGRTTWSWTPCMYEFSHTELAER